MRRRSFNAFVVLLTLAAWPRATHAQEEAAAEPDRWAFTVDFGFTAQSGNTDVVVLTSGFRVVHLQTERMEFELSGGYRYGQSQGDVVARNVQGGLKVDVYPQAAWSPFVFSSAERDAFKRLDLRSNSGGGLKHTFWRSDAGSASISLAGLYSYEGFDRGPDAIEPPSRQDARWSLRVKGERRLSEGARIEHTTFYQPVWDRAGDYDIDAATSLVVLLASRVALTLKHGYQHDSTPAPGVKRDDQRLDVGLRLEL